MPPASQPFHGQTRLIGVEFPGMHIEDAGVPGRIDLAETMEDRPERIKPEVATTGHRHIHAAKPMHRGRNLPKIATVCRKTMDGALSARNAIAIVVNGKDAR